MRFRCGMRNVVYEVLQEREWEETDGCAPRDHCSPFLPIIQLSLHARFDT